MVNSIDRRRRSGRRFGRRWARLGGEPVRISGGGGGWEKVLRGRKGEAKRRYEMSMWQAEVICRKVRRVGRRKREESCGICVWEETREPAWRGSTSYVQREEKATKGVRDWADHRWGLRGSGQGGKGRPAPDWQELQVGAGEGAQSLIGWTTWSFAWWPEAQGLWGRRAQAKARAPGSKLIALLRSSSSPLAPPTKARFGLAPLGVSFSLQRKLAPVFPAWPANRHIACGLCGFC